MAQENQVIDLTTINESLFSIAASLDKCLLLVVSCGFSLTNLLQEGEKNTYVETIGFLIRKLAFFVTCVEKVNDFPESVQKH